MDAAGREEAVSLRPEIIVNDSMPATEAALMGLGVALLAVSDVPPHLSNGLLVRLLPGWLAWTPAAPISLYHAIPTLMPRKTQMFIKVITDHFRAEKLADRFRAI